MGSSPRFPGQIRDAAVALNQKQVPIVAIAIALGVNRTTIWRWCKADGRKPYDRKLRRWVRRSDDPTLLPEFVQFTNWARDYMEFDPYPLEQLIKDCGEDLDAINLQLQAEGINPEEMNFKPPLVGPPKITGPGAEPEPEPPTPTPEPPTPNPDSPVPEPSTTTDVVDEDAPKDANLIHKKKVSEMTFTEYLRALRDAEIDPAKRYKQVVSSRLLYQIEQALDSGMLPRMKTVADFEKLTNIARKALGLDDPGAGGGGGRLQIDLHVLTSGTAEAKKNSPVIDAEEVRTPKGRLPRNTEELDPEEES